MNDAFLIFCDCMSHISRDSGVGCRDCMNHNGYLLLCSHHGIVRVLPHSRCNAVSSLETWSSPCVYTLFFPPCVIQTSLERGSTSEPSAGLLNYGSRFAVKFGFSSLRSFRNFEIQLLIFAMRSCAGIRQQAPCLSTSVEVTASTSCMSEY